MDFFQLTGYSISQHTVSQPRLPTARLSLLYISISMWRPLFCVRAEIQNSHCHGHGHCSLQNNSGAENGNKKVNLFKLKLLQIKYKINVLNNVRMQTKKAQHFVTIFSYALWIYYINGSTFYNYFQFRSLVSALMRYSHYLFETQ